MQSLSVILQSHLPTLAGAGREPTLPPLAHPPRTWHSQADGAPQNFWYERVPKSAFSQYQYRMGTLLWDERALMRYFSVRCDSAADFEGVLCRIGSVEQLLQPVKIPAEEPALRCCGVFPIFQDIEDGAIYDGQVQASDSLWEFLGSIRNGAALPCLRKHTALGHRRLRWAQSPRIF